ncbi:MAG TPA: DUF5916 domain-containing protein [Gemmatimonadales bacterium]|nr:DUF5916 domain-containing protein [Gemmatimonadales bacterium]
MPGVLPLPLAVVLVSAFQNQAPAPSDSAPRHRHAAAPEIRAARVSGSITLDGRLDESSWAGAEPASDFTQTEPAEGRPATERTEVRVLIGQDALYVGARMYDREPERIKAALARRDEEVEADEFDVYLDTFHDHLSGVRFRVTPGGATLDGILGSSAQGSEEDDSWDPIWESGTQVDSLGWTVEIGIPLSQLRYNSTADGTWGIQLYRKILRKGEESWFAFVPKSEVGGVSRYGHLVGLGPLQAQRRLELAPYLLARGSYEPSTAGDPFGSGDEYHGSAGLDLKYGITSDLTLNATINPDFGQVEVDPAVVNLSVFETFFPEKRPFFVEGADVFRFGGIRASNSFGVPDIFFSRRIGREPQRSVEGEGVNFLDAPTETSIRGAAKLSGRTRSGWSIGLLDAVTSSENARYVDESGIGVRTPVEPLTNYFVGRVRRDLRGGNSTVGMIATAVNRNQDSPELRSLLRSSAYSFGADFTNSWSDRVWSLDGSVGFSSVRGTPEAIERTQRSSARYYQRPDATSFHLDPTRTSLAGYFYQVALRKNSGRHWQGGLVYQETSPGVETNDLGFQSEASQRGISTALEYNERQPGQTFRRWGLFPFTNHQWNFDGDLVYGSYGLIFSGQLHNFWDFHLRGDYTPPIYDDRLTRGGPLGRQPKFWDVRVTLNSDTRKTTRLTANLTQSWTAADENRTEADMTLSVRPSPALRLSFGPALTLLHTLSQYVAAIPDPAATATFGTRHVFATLDQRELSMITRVDWTFTPKLSLQLFLQPLISAGDFTELKEFVRPRTYEFAVYGQDKGTVSQAGEDSQIDPGDGGATFTIPQQNFTIRSLRANAVLRWEWRPGSTFFLVWQQNRENDERFGNLRLGRDVDALFSGGLSRNVVAVKASYWLSW